MRDKFKDYTLPYGGKLRYVKNKISKSTRIEVYFASGSRKDTIPGLAHFTEHMFFTGTDKLSKDELFQKYYNFISVNAQTSRTGISFYGNVITKELESYLDLVKDMITCSTFKPKAVKDEIKVVQQEIANYNDDYSAKFYWKNRFDIFGLDEFKYAIIGTKDTVASIKSEDVKNFVNTYFVAENLDVNIISPLRFGKVKRLVNKYLVQKLNSNPSFEPLEKFYLKPKNEKFYHITNDTIKKTYIAMNFVFDANVFDHELKAKLSILLKLLNHTSGIMKVLRTDKSLVYGAGFYVEYYKDKSVVYFRTECDKENVNEILKTVADYLRERLGKGFDEEILKQVKKVYTHSKETAEPRLSKYMDKFGQLYCYGKVLNSKKLRKISMNTTLEECNELFKMIFAHPRVSATLYGDITKEEAISETEFFNLFDFSKKPKEVKSKKAKTTKSPKTTKKSPKTIKNSK